MICPQGHYAHKLRNQTSKLRAQTTRIMSNLKQAGPSQLTCTPVRRYAIILDWPPRCDRVALLIFKYLV